MSAHLTLRGLSRDFADGSPPALVDFDLTVAAGSCVGIVGPSGSGKTTVLRLASGLERPDTGDVLLDGSSVLDVAPEARGMAMVFQRPLLFPHLSVLDNIAFPARVRGSSRRRARAAASEYLDLVQLTGFGGRRPGELSGGQEQRVALARAMAAEPKVLLLDEPFSALDAALRSDMHDLLRRLRAAFEPTIVLVTHDQAEAAALADTVAVVSGGRLVQHDPVERIYNRPASLTVARLMGGRNEVSGVVRGHHFHSALGALALPVDVRVDPGPGVLVFRHESVQISDGDDPETVARGTVARVSPVGARKLLAVHVDGSAGPEPAPVTVHAEIPPGYSVRPGQQVGLLVPPHALAVVPRESGPTPDPDDDTFGVDKDVDETGPQRRAAAD